MFHIVLYQPEIPPNTGNIIRLCANTGATLHLIHPLGFSLEERQLRRAGLDYGEYADIREHTGWERYLEEMQPDRLIALSTKGKQCYSKIEYQPGDTLLFGPETRGLPDGILSALPSDRTAHIPMRPGNRSLNISNAVAVVTYEAWRQQGFRT